ncbi:MAG: hypothetical protein JRE16_10815 [Deltaproteobacteria bacterium]|jgi:hypothetical protein|nr:hypothetical protein [Deltaproteobacteria bacterium]MBW2505044.1 hypothetical protein [Deltaproteobacteria bacterium]MBW2519034.1 hypothetical protein [Deltaproteobacteria bacterium]
MFRKCLQFTSGSCLLGLILTACSGAETFVGVKYALENWIAPELSEMATLVVATDDPFSPDKTFYLGTTTQTEAKLALRNPDFFASASSGYSYWDYCYTKNRKISLKSAAQVEKCSALRLFFDDKSLLYDHSHVIISKKQNSNLTPINPPGNARQAEQNRTPES